MPVKTLNAKFVDSVQVEKRTDYYDDHTRGLVLRVTPEGRKTWNLIYARPGKGARSRYKLGRFPAMTLNAARAAAIKTQSSINDGEDPATKRDTDRKSLTVAGLADRFIEDYAKPRKKTWQEDARILRRYVLPAIGKYKVDAVTRGDLRDIIAKKEKTSPAQARHIFSTLSKMFRWAVSQDLADSNPASLVSKPAPNPSRERVLSMDEIRVVWHTLSEAAITEEMKAIFRLLLLTGQRAGEVSGMRRSEVNTTTCTWHLPGSRTKNKRPHTVPLPHLVVQILEPFLDREILFQRTGTPIEPNAVAQACRLKLQVLGERWTPHDLRRSMVTHMAEAGVAPHVIEAIVNHISGHKASVAGVYNRATYAEARRDALNLWADMVMKEVAL